MPFARTIILVDDDLDDHEVFKTACGLIDPEISVVSFENGEEAFEALQESSMRPDIIFLDLNMPRLNGVELLEKFASCDDLKSIPIIIYTTSFDARVESRCLDLGASEVVEKPNSFDLLCQKLESLLRIPA